MSGPERSEETDGFSRRFKLRMVEVVGFAIMVAGTVQLVTGTWAEGIALLGLGVFVLLNPTHVVDLIDRFLPKTGP